MAKKQTRRSISVSRTTYERLKAFCETNHISMSQLVETRVNDFLGGDVPAPASSPIRPVTPTAMSTATAMQPRPMSSPARSTEFRTVQSSTASPSSSSTGASSYAAPAPSAHSSPSAHPAQSGPSAHSSSHAAHSGSTAHSPPPMTSAAARFAVEPPPPIIKPRQDTAAPKPAEKRADQIFTF
jgi:hypothetical protein